MKKEELFDIIGDIDGDEKVNGKDLVLLRQYLAGWDVSLAK